LQIADWKEYELLDASCGEKLERFKNIVLTRPDPQIIWKTPKKPSLWSTSAARYLRSNKGGGHWKIEKNVPQIWSISHKNLCFNLKLMGFKHTGIFPEQAVNWQKIWDWIKNAKRPIKVLNLFAYTGGATLAAADAGASVCHVDSSRGMVAWARENAKSSNLQDAPIRWIVDDCLKFLKKELKRSNKYDAIILDPPSYGRGPNGEIWKLESDIYSFLEMCENLLSKNAKFLILNSYTTGLSPAVMGYLLNVIFTKKRGGRVHADEIGLNVSSNGLVLPCGSTAIWRGE
jgi:23S rRNA (cytosine1962-C5)-methyltransferase